MPPGPEEICACGHHKGWHQANGRCTASDLGWPHRYCSCSELRLPEPSAPSSQTVGDAPPRGERRCGKGLGYTGAPHSQVALVCARPAGHTGICHAAPLLADARPASAPSSDVDGGVPPAPINQGPSPLWRVDKHLGDAVHKPVAVYADRADADAHAYAEPGFTVSPIFRDEVAQWIRDLLYRPVAVGQRKGEEAPAWLVGLFEVWDTGDDFAMSDAWEDLDASPNQIVTELRKLYPAPPVQAYAGVSANPINPDSAGENPAFPIPHTPEGEANDG